MSDFTALLSTPSGSAIVNGLVQRRLSLMSASSARFRLPAAALTP